ncbi:hypothetical protein SAMN04488510_1279 [Fervidobacterium changbaicum]|uniref:SMODS-associated and fused to various effectors domain-containing protein n=1 Tax=Fervidobacterium changbaicum TaxID=310769 RepID=A0AAE5XAY3_9BACT|nr:SAVED domain-containing protein [Fervidobacterium changbaicum]QAV33193.1 hypothetical protein CBS1_05260 [Fervidobacterium changbaicum]SDH70493.1 hypothetical protein SAMN04488510_1279 [Fervidobacterium changbaicum]
MSFVTLLRKDLRKYIEFVQSGFITPGEVLADFSRLDKEISNYSVIFYEVLKFFLINGYTDHAMQMLSREFKSTLTKDQALALVNSKFVETRFPVVERERVDLVRALVFMVENADFSFTNNPNVSSFLYNVEEIAQHKISVIFDKEFCGESFQFAVAVASLVDEIPSNIAFTGKVGGGGRVLQVDNIFEKTKYCEEIGLVLITPLDVSSVYEIVDFFNTKEFNIPVYVSFSPQKEDVRRQWSSLNEEVAKHFKTFPNLKLHEKIFGMEFVYSHRELDENEFSKHIRNVYNVLRNVIQNFGVPHLAIKGPATFALGLGIAVGAKDRIAVYHYQGGYHLVLDLTTPEKLRLIKSCKSLEDLRLLSVDVYDYAPNKRKAIFLVDLASHKPFPQIVEFAKTHLPDAFIIRVTTTSPGNSGNIPIGDWSNYISELFSITQIMRDKYKELHIFLSCPVPIAFGFGMALGDYIPGKIYNYNKKSATYVPVFEMPNVFLSPNLE